MNFFRLSIVCFTLSLPAVLSGAEAEVRSVQEKLKAQDFYFGEVDGSMNDDTQTALRRYQIRNGLPVTGDLDAQTRQSLGLSASAPARTPAKDPVATADRQFLQNQIVGTEEPGRPAASAAKPEPAPTPGREERIQRLAAEYLGASAYATADQASQNQVIQWTQTYLTRTGYYQGGIDGVPGDETRRALAAFHSDQGMRPTGLLDDMTLDVMENRGSAGPASQQPTGAERVYRGQQIYRGVRIR